MSGPPRSRPYGVAPIAAKMPSVGRGQRIGLLGGSFNPAHDGHRHISRIAFARLGLDRVWWIVTPGNPLKTGGGLASQAARMDEARRIARAPRIVVTGFEAALASRYTVYTLEALVRRHPSVRFVWLMGADNLASLDRWHAWRRILELVPVAVLDRPGWRLRALSSRAAGNYRRAFVPEAYARGLPALTPPAWTFITLPLSTASSTEIRRRGDWAI